MGEKKEDGSDQALQPAPTAPKPCSQNAAGRLPPYHLHQVRCHDVLHTWLQCILPATTDAPSVSCEAGLVAAEVLVMSLKLLKVAGHALNDLAVQSYWLFTG